MTETTNGLSAGVPQRGFYRRLVGSYLAGTVVWPFILFLLRSIDLASMPGVVLFFFIFTLPYFVVALLLSLCFRPFILRNLLAWCAGAVVLVPLSWMALMYGEGGMDLIGTAGPVLICTLVYATIFYVWNRVAQARRLADRVPSG